MLSALFVNTICTQVGEKQRALETLKAETADNTRLIEELHTSLESAIHERCVLFLLLLTYAPLLV